MSNHKFTMGSLFDGSGGFPLGAQLSGIDPVWASEVEPYGVAESCVTFVMSGIAEALAGKFDK